MIELTGDPPSFKCPKCGKPIYCHRTQYAMEVRAQCHCPFEIHASNGKLTAVFNPNS